MRLMRVFKKEEEKLQMKKERPEIEQLKKELEVKNVNNKKDLN